MKTNSLKVCVPVFLMAFAASLWAAEGSALKQVKQDGKMRIGMYLGFEGLSFTQKGQNVGLEVELAELICKELSKELGREIKPEIVNQEWAQIIQELRGGKYHVAITAVIPAHLYTPYKVMYTQSYLDTGPVICCQEKDGKPVKQVTAEASSLAGKRVVVINDPAVRRVLRKAGVYVPADEGKKDLERAFPKSATEEVFAKDGKTGAPLIPVQEILQIDEQPFIYKMLANGEVDAGVIDLGIIWWVANVSDRWANKIYAFNQPVGPYIYSATTRAEDADLNQAIDQAIGNMKKTDAYHQIIKKWHGKEFDWKLTHQNFLD